MSDSDRLVLTSIIKDEQRRNAPKSTVDKYFNTFSAEQVLKKREFDLDVEQISSGVTDGGDDGGVDSIYLFANRLLVQEDTDIGLFNNQLNNIELIIIQSKNTGGFSEGAIQKLDDFTENCLRLNADHKKISKKLYNTAVLKAAAKFRDVFMASVSKKPSLFIKYYYATLAEVVHEKVQIRADLLSKKCKGHFSVADISFEFIGAAELLKLFYRKPEKTLSLNTVKHFGLSSFGTSYVCAVPLKKFYDFITENGELRTQIFESNVRDYLPNANVNRDILITLQGTASEEFWWLNNGVTIIGSEVNSTGDFVFITDPLVVNGLQTSFVLHNHFQSGDINDNRTILVRAIQCTDPESIDRIIKATNSQTQIKSIHLHATEPIHRKIESTLKRYELYYDRRKNFYKNQGKSSADIVTIQNMAQAVSAILLQRPSEARARPSTVADRNYTSIFSEKFPIEMYVKCAYLVRKVNEFLDNSEIKKSDKLNLRFYMAMYASCLALGRAKPTHINISDMVLEDITDDMLDEAYTVVNDLYLSCGANDIAAKGPSLTDKIKAKLEKRYIAPQKVVRMPAKNK
jgi:hypothetical protein